MPATLIAAELDAGAELLVRYALQAGAHWYFCNAELRSTQNQTLASYPSSSEAARLLGSELRPALARLTAVLDRLRLQFAAASSAEATLRRLGRSFVVRGYAVYDGDGAMVCQWQNQALAEPAAHAPLSGIFAAR
jgi:hypothetical protein